MVGGKFHSHAERGNESFGEQKEKRNATGSHAPRGSLNSSLIKLENRDAGSSAGIINDNPVSNMSRKN